MLKKKIETALNKQVNAEFFSAYLYLSMNAYFESLNLPGCANWMRIQFQEEMAHALKLYDYVLERGGAAKLAAIEQPQAKWKSPLAAFQAAYAHEQKVTALINGLVDLAIAESDHATNNMLQWFVAEQVEEEASADGVVQKLKMVGDNTGGLFMVDKELGARVFTPPAVSGA